VTAVAKPSPRTGTAAPVLWFTGLSGSGKSTIAVEVHQELLRRGVEVEYIDGDALREVFPNTGFTREDREEHLRRTG
jgi:adenylylsulfate kinase